MTNNQWICSMLIFIAFAAIGVRELVLISINIKLIRKKLDKFL